MKILWIFPVNKKCGISFYARDYLDALSRFTNTGILDNSECRSMTRSVKTKIQTFDIIHIQYETSLFLKSSQFFRQLHSFSKPIVVSLHEIYDNFPGVFPRSQIKGSGLIRTCKEFLYDIRHPYITYFSQHLAQDFFAHLIFVHASCHRNILITKGIKANKIAILPHPVKQISDHTDSVLLKKNGILYLTSLGFISHNYNYHLLFDTLNRLEFPWIFTWIGGVRKAEQNQLFNQIKQEITRRNWENKFIITGWVSDMERDALLKRTDIYIALFKAKSSSGSLATALSVRKPIIVTSLAYTKEINKGHHLFDLVHDNAQVIANKITFLQSNPKHYTACINNIEAYLNSYSFNEMAKRLMIFYQGLMR